MDAPPVPAAGMTVLACAWAALAAAALLGARHRAGPPFPPASIATAPPPAGRVPARRRRDRGPGLADLPGLGRRGRRRCHAEVARLAPDLVDLVAVAVAAGLNVRHTVAAVSRRLPPGPLRQGLLDVEAEVVAGARLADALQRLPLRLAGDGHVDEVVRALVAALVDAERYGAALGPTLERLSADARRARQRRAEERARRVPVKLLFPLVTCVLPSFGLLTVAPLIAGGLRALRL